MDRRVWWVLLAGFVAGAVVWAISIPLTGYREPFDSPSYYYAAAMFVAGALAAAVAPRYWWFAVIGIFIGERAYAFVMLPETRSWLLFGIIVNAIILSWLPAAIGAFIVYIAHRQFTGRSRESS